MTSPFYATVLFKYYCCMKEIAISLRAEELFHIGSFPVTNSIVLAFTAFVVLALAGVLIRRHLSLIPGAFQSIVEVALEGLLGLMDSVLGDRAKSEKYLPLVATIFLFVMISNWMGLLPGVGSLGLHAVEDGHEEFIPLFRAPAADLNFTLGLAIIAVFAANLFGALTNGFRSHFGKFFLLPSFCKVF